MKKEQRSLVSKFLPETILQEKVVAANLPYMALAGDGRTLLTVLCSPLASLWEPWGNSGLETRDGDSHVGVGKEVLLQYSFMTPLIIEKSEKSVLGAQFPPEQKDNLVSLSLPAVSRTNISHCKRAVTIL